MMAYEKGQKVRIIKPKDISEWPKWTGPMEKFNGKEITIKNIYEGRNGISVQGKETDSYWFNSKWFLSEVEEEYV